MALMEAIKDVQAFPLGTAVAVGAFAIALCGLSLWLIKANVDDQRRRSSNLPPVPGIPGLPLIGNLLQLKEKKPHKTFTRWAETYGPIYSIRTGANKMVVLNSNDVAKEAMVTRYSSISTRKLSKALTILTSNKSMVATSDYDEFSKMAKRFILNSALGTNAQKRHRVHRDKLVENCSEQLHAFLREEPLQAVNQGEIFQSELFGLAMKQGLGKDVESIYVEEFGTTFTRNEILRVLVLDMMEGAIEVDWRDFFPYLRWIPNEGFEKRIQQRCIRRNAVMRALIKEQKKRFESGEALIWTNLLNTDSGLQIAINIYGCNMDKNVWDCPEEWRPERHLDGKTDQMDLHKTMAFGGGKRVCAGALQAMLISCTTIARLLQEFQWRLADGEKDDVDIVGLTNQKLHPMRAIIKQRN